MKNITIGNTPYSVIGAYQRERKQRKAGDIWEEVTMVVESTEIVEGSKYTMVFLYALDGPVARWRGGFRGKAWYNFKQCQEGDIWRYRNRPFRKMTQEEINKFPGHFSEGGLGATNKCTIER